MQKYTSKNTSINTTKLPAIYNMIDWDKALELYPSRPRILDYGVGKPETVKLIESFFKERKFPLFPYDLYNLSHERNRQTLCANYLINTFICSNVLNVIDDDFTIQKIIDFAIKMSKGKFRIINSVELLPTYFFKIYEGDKSGVGKQTGKDQYQRNMRVKDYLTKFTWDENTLIYKGIITNPVGKLLLGGKN